MTADPSFTGEGDAAARSVRDRGSAAVEVTLVTPLLVILLLFVVSIGRLASARLAVQDVAQQTARTVTLAPDPATAGVSARAQATAALAQAHLHCQSISVAVTLTGALSAGRGTLPRPTQARVEVSCRASWQDLTGLAVPASQTVTATATSPLDLYRGTT
jgi:Flp pilus assembly protein TadG